jgi:hypothetical protein
MLTVLLVPKLTIFFIYDSRESFETSFTIFSICGSRLIVVWAFIEEQSISASEERSSFFIEKNFE